MRNPSEAPAIKASVKIQAASSDMKRTHVDNKTAGAGFKKLMATGMHPIKMQCSVRKRTVPDLVLGLDPGKKRRGGRYIGTMYA